MSATHITYKQAEAILGPYLDIYLKTGKLSRGGGFIENPDAKDEPLYAEDVISIASVKNMADYLASVSNEDFQHTPSVNPPDFPKETRHWKKAEVIKIALDSSGAPTPGQTIFTNDQIKAETIQ